MTHKHDEPAFPFEGGQNNGVQPSSGMTLRDYFAAKAIQIVDPSGHRLTWSDLARDAYALADAMLAEREREQ